MENAFSTAAYVFSGFFAGPKSPVTEHETSSPASVADAVIVSATRVTRTSTLCVPGQSLGRKLCAGNMRFTALDIEQYTVSPGFTGKSSGTSTSTSVPAATSKTGVREIAWRISRIPSPTWRPSAIESNWSPSCVSSARAVWNLSQLRPSRSLAMRLTVPMGVPRCPRLVESIGDSAGFPRKYSSVVLLEKTVSRSALVTVRLVPSRISR